MWLTGAYSNTAVADTLQVTGGGNMSTSDDVHLSPGQVLRPGYPASFPFILNIEPGTSNSELVLVHQARAPPRRRGSSARRAGRHDR